MELVGNPLEARVASVLRNKPVFWEDIEREGRVHRLDCRIDVVVVFARLERGVVQVRADRRTNMLEIQRLERRPGRVDVVQRLLLVDILDLAAVGEFHDKFAVLVGAGEEGVVVAEHDRAPADVFHIHILEIFTRGCEDPPRLLRVDVGGVHGSELRAVRETRKDGRHDILDEALVFIAEEGAEVGARYFEGVSEKALVF